MLNLLFELEKLASRKKGVCNFFLERVKLSLPENSTKDISFLKLSSIFILLNLIVDNLLTQFEF